jgi:hypothetical protein
VNEMRLLCARHNARIIAIDAPMGTPDLRSRILPDAGMDEEIALAGGIDKLVQLDIAKVNYQPKNISNEIFLGHP